MKLTCRLFLFLTVLAVFPATVTYAQNTHSVWSKRPLYVTDGELGKSFKTFVKGNAAAAWTQGTTRAYFRAVAIITATVRYDFEVVRVTSTNGDMIEGLYDIKRNGVLVCDDCIGKAYLLSGPVGNYFKVYVGTPAGYAEKWLYSGYITNRFDF